MPTHVSEEPQLLTLEKLISAELSTYIGSGIARSQNYSHVVELIHANQLPREYGIDPRVRELYRKMWDELHQPDTAQ